MPTGEHVIATGIVATQKTMEQKNRYLFITSSSSTSQILSCTPLFIFWSTWWFQVMTASIVVEINSRVMGDVYSDLSTMPGGYKVRNKVRENVCTNHSVFYSYKVCVKLNLYSNYSSVRWTPLFIYLYISIYYLYLPPFISLNAPAPWPPDWSVFYCRWRKHLILL